MPFSGFDDFEDCLETMTEEEGHDMDSAENICGALQAEEKSDHGNVEELADALERGAGLIADVGVDLVSGVDVPAVDSKWVMTKSGGARKGHDFRAESPILLAKDDASADQRISYAAAMIPREPDKEGDVVATPTVEKAAHDFLKGDGGVDTDHSLIDGEGEVVESWVLKQERTFDLPGGETESYGAGTWMVGIEWGAEAWDRIKAGDLTGLSIYGMAEHIPLERTRSTSKTPDTHKGEGAESNDMAPDTSGDGGDDATGDGDSTDDGPTIGEVAASVDDLAETVADVTDTLSTVKEAVETEKQDAREAAQILAEEFELDGPDAVLDAVQEKAEDGDDEEEDDDEEMEESADETEPAEKRADEAKLEKGGDARGTAAKGIESDADNSGSLSYKALAEQTEAE